LVIKNYTSSLFRLRINFETFYSCGLDGPGIESLHGKGMFSSPEPSSLAPGPTHHPNQWLPGLLPEGKER
jgi:hypothetical protein